jgi:hypothetical protein
MSEDLLKKRSAGDNVRFSDIVEAALKEYLAKKKK